MNRIENVKNHISQNLPDINILKTISFFPAGFGDIDFDIQFLKDMIV